MKVVIDNKEEVEELRRQLDVKEQELLRRQRELEEVKVNEFDRLFGVHKAKGYFYFADPMFKMLQIAHENLNNLPKHPKYKISNIKSLADNLVRVTVK